MEDSSDLLLYQTGTFSRLDEFRDNCLRRRSSIYTAWLGFSLLLVSSLFFVVRNAEMSSLGPSLVVYYFICTVHVVFRLNTGWKSSNILAPDLIFIGFYTLFHLGYVTLYAMGLIEYSDRIIWFPKSMPQSMFVINIGLVAFLLGFELAGPKHDVLEYEQVKTPTWQWSIISTSFMAIGLFLHISCLFILGIDTILAHGYEVIGNFGRYSSPGLETLFWTGTMMGVVGTIISVVTSSLRFGKLFHSKVALTLVVIFAVIFLLEGDRGYLVQMIMAIVLVRHYFVKKIPVAFFVGFLVAVLALMSSIAMIRYVVLDPSKMIEEYKHVLDTGQATWQSPFVEAGGSFRVTSIITHEVPLNKPYWKGQSFISAIIRIVPFLDGITQKMGLRGAPSYGSSPATWVTYTYAGVEASGMGFTVSTEGYLNFGYPGVFLELFMVGFFVRWLIKSFSRHPSAAWAIIMLGCLGASFMLTRNHTLNFTSACSQVAIIAGLLSLLCKNEPPMMENQ